MGVQNDLAVIKNPFSTASITAKVPDGAVNLSCAERNQYVNTFNMHTTTSLVILAPNLSSPAQFHFEGTAPKDDPLSSTKKPYTLLTPHKDEMIQIKCVNDALEDMDLNTDGLNILKLPDAAPEQFRIVSQGMRLSMISNSMDDDGWWEAIRVQKQVEWPDLTYKQGYKYVGDKQVVPYLHPIIAFNGTITDDWINNPTYTSGKLRDISKHLFTLHTRTNTRSFNGLKKQVPLELKPDPRTRASGEQEGTFSSGDIVMKDVNVEGDFIPGTTGADTPPWFDSNFDTVLIKIYANPATKDGVVTSGTLMHAHTIQNVEYTFPTTSMFSKFQTPCYKYLGLLGKTDNQIKKDSRPSIIRIPGYATTNTSKKRGRKGSRNNPIVIN